MTNKSAAAWKWSRVCLLFTSEVVLLIYFMTTFQFFLFCVFIMMLLWQNKLYSLFVVTFSFISFLFCPMSFPLFSTCLSGVKWRVVTKATPSKEHATVSGNPITNVTHSACRWSTLWRLKVNAKTAAWLYNRISETACVNKEQVHRVYCETFLFVGFVPSATVSVVAAEVRIVLFCPILFWRKIEVNQRSLKRHSYLFLNVRSGQMIVIFTLKNLMNYSLSAVIFRIRTWI